MPEVSEVPLGSKRLLFPPTSASGCNLDELGEVLLLIPLLVLVLELKPVEALFVCNSSFPGTEDCRMTLVDSISGRVFAAAAGEPELILLAFPTFFRDLMGVIMLAEVAAAPPEASGGSTMAGRGFFGMAPAAL